MEHVMSDHQFLAQLLESWETLRSQGEEPTAVELCRGHEELIPELQQRIDAKRTLEGLIEEWEEQVDSGLSPHAEDICRAHPELLDEFRAEVAALERFDNLFGAAGDSSPSADEIREFCNGRYEVEEVYASGGLGVLYNAVDRELNRAILVKTMLPRTSAVPDSREHFEREAYITGQLEHPGVVPVYGFGRDSAGRPYYAMKYVRGENLREAVRRYHAESADSGERTLEFQKLLRSFIAVCQTVAFAHSRQIIHRDLKPQNIMLGKYGEVLVIDWGLAKSTKEPDREPAAKVAPVDILAPFRSQPGVKGTPAYMSPEQASPHKEPVGPASDIFSLGATLFEILTGQGPFSGRSSSEVLKQVTSETIPRATGVNPKTPRALEAICLKAMQKKPGERYADAQEMARDVERYLANEPVSAWKEPWTVRLPRIMRRHRALSTGLAAAAAVALVSITIAAALVTYKDRLLSRANDELVARNEEMRESGYVSNFLVAKAEWERGRTEVARRILDQTDPDLRGLEWSALKVATPDQLGLTPRGTLAAESGLLSAVRTMTHVDVTPDWGLVAAASLGAYQPEAKARQDWQIDVHGVRSKALLFKVGGAGFVGGLRFSKDGRRLGAIVAPFRPAGKPVDTAGALLKQYEPQLRNPERYRSLLRRFQTPKSEPAAPQSGGQNDKVTIPDAQAVAKGPESPPQPADAKKSTTNNSLPVGAVCKVWDAKTGAELDTGGPDSFRETFGLAYATPTTRGGPKQEQFRVDSADGKLFAVVDSNAIIRVRWSANQNLIDEVVRPSGNRVWLIRLDADGQHLDWIDDDEILRSKLLTPRPQRLSSAPAPSEVMALAAVPDGESLVSVHSDGFVRIWDLRAGREARKFRFTTAPVKLAKYSFALSPDGSWLVVVEPEGVRVLDVATGSEKYRLPNLRPPINFSPDGGTLVAIQQPHGKTSATKSAKVEASKKTSRPGEIGYNDVVESGAALGSGDPDTAQTGVLVFDTKTGVAAFHPHRFLGLLPDDVAVSPRNDEFAVLLSGGNEVELWDLRRGYKETRSIKQVHEKTPATRLFYGPDGKTLLTVDSLEAHLWDIERWRPIATLQGHTSDITSVEFLHDQKRIATASIDGHVGLWDAKTGFAFWFFQDWEAKPLWAVREVGGKLVGGSQDILIWEAKGQPQ